MKIIARRRSTSKFEFHTEIILSLRYLSLKILRASRKVKSQNFLRASREVKSYVFFMRFARVKLLFEVPAPPPLTSAVGLIVSCPAPRPKAGPALKKNPQGLALGIEVRTTLK